MKRLIEFITDVMEEYTDGIENNLAVFGECMGEIAEYIVGGVKYLLTGLLVVIGYLFLAVTMPVWYLPYKHFKRKQKA